MHYAKRFSSSYLKRRLPAGQVDNHHVIQRQTQAVAAAGARASTVRAAATAGAQVGGAGGYGKFMLTGPITLTVVQEEFTTSPPARTTSLSTTSTRPVATTRLVTSQQSVIAQPIPATTQPPTLASPSVAVSGAPVVPIQPNAALGDGGNIIPTGAIVGAILAIFFVFIIIAIILLRKRFIFNRKKKRNTWATPGKGPISSRDFAEGKYTDSGIFFERSGTAGGGVGREIDGTGFTMLTPMTAAAALAITKQAPPLRLVGSVPISPATPATKTPMSTAQTPLSIPATAYSGSTTTTSNQSSAVGYPSPESPDSLLPNAATVKSTFIPTMPDELPISLGEIVRVLAEYDDGWAFCGNVLGQQGMVPIECLKRGVVGIPRLNGISSNGLGSGLRAGGNALGDSATSLRPGTAGEQTGRRTSSLGPSFMKI